MRFSLEFPGVLYSKLPTEHERHSIMISLALEKPSILIKGEKIEGKGKLELVCNCPDGEEQARQEAKRLTHLIRLELSFKKTEPSTPFSCRVCRPAVAMIALSLAREAPRPLEEVEMLLNFKDSIILRTVHMGGASAYLVPSPEPDPPASPWLIHYWVPPPSLRIVIARLPELEPPEVQKGDRAVNLLSVLFKMLWENELYHMPGILRHLAASLGWGEMGLPFFPVEDEHEWYWAPLPSPEECSRDLIAYRERLAGFLDEKAVERLVTRLSPGGVLEVW